MGHRSLKCQAKSALNDFFFEVYFYLCEGQIFHLLIDFPHARNSQAWARWEPVAKFSMQLSHLGNRNPSTQTIIYFPGTLTGSWLKSRGRSPFQVVQYWPEVFPNWWFNPLCHIACPCIWLSGTQIVNRVNLTFKLKNMITLKFSIFMVKRRNAGFSSFVSISGQALWYSRLTCHL